MSNHQTQKINQSTRLITTPVIIGLASITLIITLYVASNIILGNSISVLEEQDVREDAMRVQALISNDLDTLNSTVADWAFWDETYDFVQDSNLEYIQNNLLDESMAQIRLNLILYLQPSGKLVFGKALNLETQKSVPIPVNVLARLGNPNELELILQNQARYDGLTGILLLPEGTLLFAARPILTSEAKGPIQGTLVMGRYLNSAELTRLSRIGQIPIQSYRADNPQLALDFRTALAELTSNQPIFVQSLDDNTIAAYWAIKDITNAEKIMFRIEKYRGIYQQGQTTQRYFILCFIAITAVFASFTQIMIHRLSVSQQEQQESEERYRAVVEQASEGILLLDADTLEILEANQACRDLLGFTNREILASSVFSLIACERATLEQNLRNIIVQKHASLGEQNYYRMDGTLLATESTASLVAYQRKQVICVVIRDITQRKRAQAQSAVVTAISHVIDLNQVLDLALDQVLTVLQVDVGAIYLANEEQTELVLAVERNLPNEFLSHGLRYPFGVGITGYAAQQRETILSADVAQDPRFIIPLSIQSPLQSQVSVPLITQNRVVGVLNVNGRELHVFGENDLELLRTIGSGVAVAIDHARLFETLEQRVAERTAKLTLLNHVSSIITQSLNLNVILNGVVEELSRLLHTHGAWAGIFDVNKNQLVIHAEHGDTSGYELGKKIPLEGTLVGKVIHDKKAYMLEIAHEPINNFATPETLRHRSVAMAPMMVHNRVVGVVGVTSDSYNSFNDTELRWLSAVGETVAVAVENASLFESVEQQRTQLATLRDIDRTLNSILELGPMLETMLKRLEPIISFDTAVVMLLEENTLRVVAARGKNQEKLAQYSFDIAQNKIFQQMAEHHVPMRFDDLASQPGWVVLPGLEFARSWVSAPLVARDQLIGQIGLFSANPSAFTPSHTQVLHTFSSHSAIAIANAMLRTELKEQAERDSLTQVLNHGTFVSKLRIAAENAISNQTPLSMIMLDLDNFKQYNDLYGHPVGDAVLRATVNAIGMHVRTTDLIGRWGGEEFAIALYELDAPQAMKVAARIRATLAETRLTDWQGKTVPSSTASLGIASIPESANTADELIEHADRALYRAKAQGRNQVAVY